MKAGGNKEEKHDNMSFNILTPTELPFAWVSG
jgi:hypothetical protein